MTWRCCCRWAVLFSHPRDYTPVCTTELGRVLVLGDEFKKRGVKLIALSCDSVDDHVGWSKVLTMYTVSHFVTPSTTTSAEARY